MSNVQQPEMRRSGDDPLVQDSVKNKVRPQAKTPRGRPERHGEVPPGQRSPYPS